MALIDINLNNNDTINVPQDVAAADGDTLDLTLGGNNTIVVDGVDVDISGTFSGSVLGNNTIEVNNGANATVGGFANISAGQQLTYKIGEDSSLSYGGETVSAGLLNSTTIDFTNSNGTGTLHYEAPTADLNISARPDIVGLHAGDTLDISKGNLIGDPSPTTRVTFEDGVLTAFHGSGTLLDPYLPNASFNVPDAPADGTFSLDDNGQIVFACFLRGTMIATPDGEAAVEDLRPGDRVSTASGKVAMVKWVGYRKLHRNRIATKDALRAFPIHIAKDALAENVPSRELIVSPGHHLFFDGALVPALALVNGLTIKQDRQARSFEYFHVELEQFDILLANGTPAESYVDTGNRSMFQNAETVAMHPDFGPAQGRPTVDGIQIARTGPIVNALRKQLLERAEKLTGAKRITSPDLHILVDGQKILPVQANAADGTFVFELPADAGGKDIHILSRSAAVRETSNHVRMDRRHVGVGLAGISITEGDATREIDLFDSRLMGLHAGQDVHGVAMRWTVGQCVIPATLSALSGKATLELQVLRTYTYWNNEAERNVRAA